MKTTRLWLIYCLVLSTSLVCGLQTSGLAMLAPAHPSAAPQSSRAEDMRAIQTALESKIVRQKLAEYGLNEHQIQSRLSRLSDEQVHQLAVRSQAVNAGGDGGGVIVGALLIVPLVLPLIYLAKRI